MFNIDKTVQQQELFSCYSWFFSCIRNSYCFLQGNSNTKKCATLWGMYLKAKASCLWKWTEGNLSLNQIGNIRTWKVPILMAFFASGHQQLACMQVQKIEIAKVQLEMVNHPSSFGSNSACYKHNLLSRIAIPEVKLLRCTSMSAKV